MALGGSRQVLRGSWVLDAGLSGGGAGGFPSAYLTTHRVECSSTAIKTFTVRDVGSSVFAARAGWLLGSHGGRWGALGRHDEGEDR